jgi:hypothetical protein
MNKITIKTNLKLNECWADSKKAIDMLRMFIIQWSASVRNIMSFISEIENILQRALYYTQIRLPPAGMSRPQETPPLNSLLASQILQT